MKTLKCLLNGNNFHFSLDNSLTNSTTTTTVTVHSIASICEKLHTQSFFFFFFAHVSCLSFQEKTLYNSSLNNSPK